MNRWKFLDRSWYPFRFVSSMTRRQASIGRPLIAEPVRVGRSSGCDCQLKANEALGLVLGRLGNVIDTRTGTGRCCHEGANFVA